MVGRTAIAIAALVAVPAATPAPTAALPPGFSDERVAQIERPTAIAFVPDGRILVTGQRGQLHVIRGDRVLPTPALDLTDGVCSDSERGLLGVAVDPAFPARPHVYLYYTFDKHGGCERRTARVPVNRVSRFTLRGDAVDPASELVLVDEIPSFNGNHNGGDVQFGPDRLLYVTVGDGGCDYAGGGCAGANDAARDRHALLGKVLRIAPDGSVPAGNPWQGPASVRCAAVGVAQPGTECRETFAWGLRNPFRIAFDPNSADRFFINDVGQNVWEEIDLGQAGADYGWNLREGSCATGSSDDCGPAPAAMTNPVFAYGREGGCISITGGAFVPAGAWPREYDGAYLFADLGCGIFLLEESGGGFARRPFAPDLPRGVVHLAFGTAARGRALYYATHAGGGEIRRIVHAAAARAAVRSFSVGRAARAGRSLVARLDATGTGPVSAVCAARIGSRSLAPIRSLSRRPAGVVATCSWRLPPRTAGRRLRGSVTVTVGGVRLARTFVRTIRL